MHPTTVLIFQVQEYTGIVRRNETHFSNGFALSDAFEGFDNLILRYMFDEYVFLFLCSRLLGLVRKRVVLTVFSSSVFLVCNSKPSSHEVFLRENISSNKNTIRTNEKKARSDPRPSLAILFGELGLLAAKRKTSHTEEEQKTRGRLRSGRPVASALEAFSSSNGRESRR